MNEPGNGRDGKAASQALQAQPLPRRFFEQVSVGPEAGQGFGILLDGKMAKTPGKRPLCFPNRVVADAVAREWRAQGERIDPTSMPLTRLANTAFDGIAGREDAVTADMLAYAETDLLCYRISYPAGHAQLQKQRWDPILDWAREVHGLPFVMAEGVIHVEQPPSILPRMADLLGPLVPLELAALHTITTLSGSAILMLAVQQRFLAPSDAWSAATVDEDWQISQWGLVDEAAVRRARRTADYMAAGALLQMVAPASE